MRQTIGGSVVRWNVVVAAIVVAGSMVLATERAGAERRSPGDKDWPPPAGAECRPGKGASEDAEALRKVGRRALIEGKPERAADYFEDAYRRNCKAHDILKELARAHEEASAWLLAIDDYELYFRRGNPSGDDLKAVTRKIEYLTWRVELETAHQRQTPPVSTAAPVLPGGEAPLPSPSDLDAAKRPEHSSPPTMGARWSDRPLLMPPPLVRRRREVVFTWIAVGTGVAAAVVGGVMAGIGDQRAGQIRARQSELFGTTSCSSEPTRCHGEYDARLAADLSEAENLRTAGYVTFAVASSVAAGGLLTYLLMPHFERITFGTRVELVPGPTTTGVGVRAPF